MDLQKIVSDDFSYSKEELIEFAIEHARDMCILQREKDIRFITDVLGYDMQSEEKEDFLNQILVVNESQ